MTKEEVSGGSELLSGGDLESAQAVDTVQGMLQGDIFDALGMSDEVDLLCRDGHGSILSPGEEVQERE